MKNALGAILCMTFSTGQTFSQNVAENQFYTFAQVIDSSPVYGKRSLECITCPSVLIGHKIGVQIIQKTQKGDTPITFEMISKSPIPIGTWVKVGIRMNLVIPIKNEKLERP